MAEAAVAGRGDGDRVAVVEGCGTRIFLWEARGFSGVGAFGLPGIDGVAIEAIFAVFLLLLLAALFLLFSFLAAIAHGEKSSLRLV